MSGSSTDTAPAVAKAAMPKAKAAPPVVTGTSLALVDLVADLEDARQKDVNGDVKKLEELEAARQEAKRELNRLQA